MAAVKPQFYKVRGDMPDVCEGIGIGEYFDELCVTFGKASVERIDPESFLPEGPIYYADAPRNCHNSPVKYGLEDAISDCLRLYDKSGKAKHALAELIANRAIADTDFRDSLLAYNRVPQSWQEILRPVDPQEPINRERLVEALSGIHDRDYSHPNRAKGLLHPLAAMVELGAFPDQDKLSFVADYLIGRAREDAAPWAVRIGRKGNYREYNLVHWLMENRAFILETVGDIVRLKEHFTKSNRLKRGPLPELPQLKPGAMKNEP